MTLLSNRFAPRGPAHLLAHLEESPAWYLVPLLGINAVFLWTSPFRFFNFFDFSNVLGASWRLASGQRPYLDFSLTIGPIHFYLLAAFFKLFGFGKFAIAAHLIFVSSLAIAAVFFMLWKKVPLPAVLAGSALTLTGFYWPTSFPWYTQSALLFGMAAVALLLHRWHGGLALGAKTGFALGFLAILSFFTKPNVGLLFGALLAACTWFWPTDARKGRLTFWLGAAAAVFLVRVLWIPSFSAFLDQTFFGFIARPHIRGLATRLFDPAIWFLNYYWVPALAVFLSGCWRTKRFRVPALLCGGLWWISIIHLGTSGSVWQTEVGLMGLTMGAAFLSLHEWLKENPTPVLHSFCRVSLRGLYALSAGLIILYAYYGLILKSWSSLQGTFFIDDRIPEGTYAIQAGPMRGWRCEEGDGVALDAFTETIQKALPPEKSLLVLSNLQVLYPLTGRPGFAGMPWCFYQGVFAAPEKERQRLSDFIQKERPDAIVTHTKKMPFLTNLVDALGLKPFLLEHYTPVQSLEGHVLWMRKGGGPEEPGL